MMNYYVVKFELDKTVEAVPECWVTIDEEGVKCAWPPGRGRKMIDVIRKPMFPADDWKIFTVEILRKCGMFT